MNNQSNNFSDLERNSLDAHVQMCAERHKAIVVRIDTHVDQEKLDTAALKEYIIDRNTATNLRVEQLEAIVDNLFDTVKESRSLADKTANKQMDRIMSWGVGIISALVAAICFFLAKHLNF